MAHQPVALILNEESLERRLIGRGPVIRPGTAIVVADADGHAFQLDRRPSWSECVTARYRTQFVVDTTDHTSTLTETLPSRDDVFSFQASIDVGWRVTDAREVVLRRVADGLAVARSHLLDLMAPITRGFDQADPGQAESALNIRLRGHPLALPEGITLFRVSVRLSREQGNQEWIQAQVLKDRERQQMLDRFADESASAHHANTLAGISQQGDLRRVEERLVALRATLPGVDELTLRHLATHPDDTGGLLAAIGARRTEDRNFQLQMIERFIAAGLIERAAVQGILEGTGVSISGPALQPPYGAPQIAPPAAPAQLTPPGGGAPGALPPGSQQPATPSGGQQPSGSRQSSAPPPETWDEEPPSTGAPSPNVIGHRRVTRPAGAERAGATGTGPTPSWETPEEDEEPLTEPLLDDDAEPTEGQGGAQVIGWRPRRRPEL
ncbi:hypothetical protein [Parafrankia sp. EUN1f]|uniref:hypothetical protein n=1 Tax=Parafrankia sp. EUN1f TaxID=102897 RepID=UPI0001C44AC7|nr:hypothetical protein [Parafrankia sp. EUN1f]EFC83777.1 hypothetical protein FrEUN1fDRAFT_3137 [Parafrankia sp. EUN1f]